MYRKYIPYAFVLFFGAAVGLYAAESARLNSYMSNNADEKVIKKAFLKVSTSSIADKKKRPAEMIVTPPLRGIFSMKANRPPRLEPIFGEIKNRRLRLIRSDMEVTVRARATDPDGDDFRYKWIVERGAGTIDNTSKPVVTWKSGQAGKLHLFVIDQRGAYAHSYLPISKSKGVLFAGQVISNLGKPLDDVLVDVNAETTRTDTEGFFRLWVSNSEAERFVLNLKKPGYSMVSKVYDAEVRNGRWTMNIATKVVSDPRQPISGQDTSSQVGCLGPLSGRVDWSRYPEQRSPRFVDAAGNLSRGQVPAQLQRALDAIEAGTQCSPGISVAIPANSLVDASGKPPEGKVAVTLSTVDLYTPDSMPGDYTVEVDGINRWMQSFGAGTVSVTADGRQYQLQKGMSATVVIPVDPLQLQQKARLDPKIPLLWYDAPRGTWVEHGKAALNAAGDAYVGEIRHFSAFNTDLIKTSQACVRIDTSAMPASFNLEVIIPMEDDQAPVVKTYAVSPDTSQPNQNIHAIYNLPSSTWILLIAIHEPSPGNFVPLGSYMVNTNGQQIPSTPNRPNYDYQACQTQVALAPVQPRIDHVVNGSGRHEGPLPVHIYTLADEATGTNIYCNCYLFSLFDSGSTKVRIYNAHPYLFDTIGDPNSGLYCNLPHRITDGNYFGSDAWFLGLSGPKVVRIRLNGLARIDPTNRAAPVGEVGSAYEPEVELTGVEVRPQPSTEPLDVTLVGAPVIHQVVAKIDYTQEIVRSGYDFYPGLTLADSQVGVAGFQRIDTVRGPDITFYYPDDPNIPFPDLMLELERFGMPERYYLKNVTFQEGTLTVSDQNPATPIKFLYDTGTTRTFISDQVATLLNLHLQPGDFDCFASGDKLGYTLDAVVMEGPNGTYTVQNASVCWDESKIKQLFLYQVVIGSNLFDQVPVFVDGPRNRLGIGPPSTSPVTWVPLPRNCQN